MFKALKEFLFGKPYEDVTAPYKVEQPKQAAAAPAPVEQVKISEAAPAPTVVEVVKAAPAKAEKPKKQTFEKKAVKSEAKKEVAAARSRNKGKFVGDDKSTSGVNEAFKAGKAPEKKPKAKAVKAPKADKSSTPK